MKLGRRYVGAQNSWLKWTSKYQWPTKAENPIFGLLVGANQHTAAAAKGFGQGGCYNCLWMQGSHFKGITATMLTRPAQAVGIIDVDIKVWVTLLQPGQLSHGGNIAIHTVDAVGEVPDLAVAARHFFEPCFEVFDCVVPKQLHGCAAYLEHPCDVLNTGMGLVVHKHGIAFVY